MRHLVTILLAVTTSAACATYLGGAIDIDRATLRREPGWIWLDDVELVRQHGDTDCGAAAMTIVLNHYGAQTTLEQTLAALEHPDQSQRAGEMRDLAKQRGYDAFLFSATHGDIEKHLRKGRPLIVGLVKPTASKPISHYEVVVGFHPVRQMVVTLHPARGMRRSDWPDFMKEWVPTKQLALVVVP